jgi:NADH dehydrogenase [ubiquinone] 1 alpha subcomplex assembly factor 1
MGYKIFLIIMIATINQKMTIFDFSERARAEDWQIINDGVMGGLSHGSITVSDGLGRFEGKVSTDNNGGFTMARAQFERKNVSKATAFILKLKGDGKEYQFRAKSDKFQMHSYVHSFLTTGEWQEIKIPFKAMQPRFRGRDLDQPNYGGESLEEIAFLIGNKKSENFELLIESIKVE